ncbi:flagellar hook-length control protein FliK [Enterovibrio sp. ZSDZ42]|uniref:Flagellar hook-length control protein FliK n=1 Tax=Enterovibrio gelatinilyticus TaxID=2899819 RepID=A0ABT5QXV1_9GAMM|nr:flagellar hook-length control protein FliK [Enterovibrio sp. ZSDZ42]MDD1792430.1 flagellar hook-length control protein FliK [Enterovibrio sp. ZSDZ42]
MKIDNTSNIKVLTLESIKSNLHEKLLNIGQEKAVQLPQTQLASSQLSQVLRLINLFPLLMHSPSLSSPAKAPDTHALNTTMTPSMLSILLKTLVMPNTPELAAKWLSNRQSDKALLDALRQVTTSMADNDGNGKIKALLMLLTEQRVLEGNKTNEYHWYFPLSHVSPTPVHITAKKKTLGRRKKSHWSISVNLTLSKRRHLTATADIYDQSLALRFTTDSASLEKLIEQSLPALEQQLSKHHICVSQCEINVSENTEPTSVEHGVNIQV